MKRWYLRRGWLWAVGGLATATGLALAQGGRAEAPPPPPKVGEVITLRFHDGRDRTVKVLKSERQPDGSYLSEVRDVKTGEVFNLLDPPQSNQPVQKPSSKLSSPKPGGIPSPASPPPSTTAPTSSKEKSSRSNRPLLNLFRSSKADPSNDPNTRGTDTDRRPGLFQRLFGGSKKDSSPESVPPAPGLALPPGTVGSRPNGRPAERLPIPPSTPGHVPGSSSVPPPSTFPLAMPPRPTNTPAPQPSTPEPPRAQPGTPPGTPSASPPLVPPIPNPAPLPSPAVPAPVPDVPPVPPITIPVPPGGGMSRGTPMSGIAPASAQQASLLSELPPPIARDLQPYVHALHHAVAPSARALAARALADSPQGSTPAVKNLLFHVCRKDPAPFVRACCIDELAKLGYTDPAFLAYLRQACEEGDESVRLAAQLALQKLEVANPSQR